MVCNVSNQNRCPGHTVIFNSLIAVCRNVAAGVHTDLCSLVTIGWYSRKLMYNTMSVFVVSIFRDWFRRVGMRPFGWRGRLSHHRLLLRIAHSAQWRSIIENTRRETLLRLFNVFYAYRKCLHFITNKLSFFFVLRFRGRFICLLMLFLHFLEQNWHFAFEIGFVVRDFDVRDSFINIR